MADAGNQSTTVQDLGAIMEDLETLSIENNNQPSRELLQPKQAVFIPQPCNDPKGVGNNNNAEEDDFSATRHVPSERLQGDSAKKDFKTAWMQPEEEDGNGNITEQTAVQSTNKLKDPGICNVEQQTILQQSSSYSFQGTLKEDDYELDEFLTSTNIDGDDMDADVDDDDYVDVQQDTGANDSQDYNTDVTQGSGQTQDTELFSSEKCQTKSEEHHQGQDHGVISEESLLESEAMLQSHVVMLDEPAGPEGAMSLSGVDVQQSTEMFREVMLTQVQQQLEDLDRELKMHLSRSEMCLLLHRDKMNSYLEQAGPVFTDDDVGLEQAGPVFTDDDVGITEEAAYGWWEEPQEVIMPENSLLLAMEDLDCFPENSVAKPADWMDGLMFASNIREMQKAVDERVSAIRPPSEDEDEETSDDVTRFEHLPAELVNRILSYLTVPELCACVAPVCRSWYRYAHDPLLWQELDLDLDFNHDVTAVDLCAMIRRAPLLKALVLRGRNELTITEVSVFVKYCSMLQHLDMGFCKVLDLTMLHIIVDSCAQLEVVNVEGCDSIGDSCLIVLSTLAKLRELNLSHCTSVTDDGVCHLVKHSPLLTFINIDGIAWITDDAVQDIAAHCPLLRQLYLDGDELTDVSICAVTESCPQLELLDISFCEGITDQSVQNIAKLQHLKHLRLKRGVQLSTAVLLHLFQSASLAGLTHLNLTECTAVQDRVVERIAKCCPDLCELHLCWCWDITEPGLEHIVNNLSKLVHLDLTGLDKITGACLTKVPSALPLLTYLDLQQCNRVQDEVLSTLVATVTKLTIRDYYGNKVPPLLTYCQ